MKSAVQLALIAVLFTFIVACSSGNNAPYVPSVSAGDGGKEAHAMAFTLASSSFQNGENIPRVSTCDSDDRSPGLVWHGAPAGTQSFALIVDDPDAPSGTFVHWVLFDIPASLSSIPESGLAEATVLGGTLGRNDFGKLGYNGPCPPPGKPHRYFFKLYALDAPLKQSRGATKAAVEAAMKGHILGQATLMGKYGR